MKKILSILICLVLGISSAWAVDATLNVTINTEVRSTPNAQDGVIVSSVCQYTEVNGEVEENCAQSLSGYQLIASMNVPASHDTYLSLPDHSDEYKDGELLVSGNVHISSEYILTDNGYVFSHWEASENVTINNNPSAIGVCDYTIKMYNKDLFNITTSHSWGSWGAGTRTYSVTAKTGVSKTITFTAVWVQPQVTGVDGDHTLTPKITDVNETRTQDVVFNVANVLDKYNFTCESYGEGFSYGNTKLSAGKDTYTATAIYTPSGIHGTHTGSLTLTSNHPSTGATTRTSNLTIEEDYTPEYDLPFEYIMSTLEKPTYVGAYTQLMETDIVPTNLNYAARTALPLGAVEKKNGSEWKIELVDNPSGFFSIVPFDASQVVRFEPTGEVDENEQFSATIKLTCTYYDAVGNPIPTSRNVTLYAYAKNDADPHLEIDGVSVYNMDLDVIYGTPQKKSVSYVALNLSGTPVESWTSSSDKISYRNNGSLITVSTATELPLGSHTAALTYTYGELSATLNITADVELATPVLEAYGGLSQITLVWTPVYGADKYIIKSGETTIDEVLAPADSYTIKGLTNGTSVSYTVTAVYEADQQYNKTSNTATATPNLPTTITPGDYPYIGLYSGTEKYLAGHNVYGKFPYRAKRAVDLSAAFKDGGAAFDRLFVFGLTSGDASDNITVASVSTGSNAVTPCYVYRKVGINYELVTTIPNVNVATKPSEFNISISDEIRSAYFTGYSPYTSCGSTWEENGVFFVGGEGEIDLYFDNLQLYARPKSTNGSTTVAQQPFSITGWSDIGILGRDDVDGQIIGGVNVKFYTQGTGSVFCFQPIKNGQTLQPTIHLNDENILASTQGVHLFVKVDFMSVTLDRNATQHSAPIQIIHNKNTIKTSTELTIDDQWNSSARTNGILNLATADFRPAPTIDLGYSNTTLNINGGQMFLSNSFNNSDSYDVSYAISYRQKSMMDGLANIYGLGDDQPGGKVRFNDGTINCKPLSLENFNSAQGQKLFHNPTSMKCPQDTKIDGGTFNCDVLACSSTTSKGSSPTNSKGQPVCLVTLPIESINASNGTAILPNDWMMQAVELGSNTANLEYHGISSMTPVVDKDENMNEIQVVNLMLPSNKLCFKEVITTPWVACFPRVKVSAAGQSYTLGGDVDVDYSVSAGDEGLTIVERTSKLMYGEMDQYVRRLFEGKDVDGTMFKYTAPGGEDLTVTLVENGISHQVTNITPYAVYDKIYMLMPLVANQWKMFVPPFDVANVYVIEPYTEERLIEKYDANGDKKLTNSESSHEIDKARYDQASRMMDFMYQWLWSIVGMQSNSDIWSNTSQAPAMGNIYSYGTFMQTWLEMYEGMADKPTVKNCIQQLYHYKSSNEGYPTGMSRWDANFYLYEADGTEWTVGADGINTVWKEVPTISKPRKITEDHNVIMKKGGVYVMSFPSTIVNNEIYDYVNTWDYWTGKYIIIEGYPEEDIDTDGDRLVDDKAQIISGSEYDWNNKSLTNSILSPYDTENSVSLRGNSTFAKLDISQKNNSFVLNNYFYGKDYETDEAYIPDPESPHNVYVPAQLMEEELTPGQGFILANIDAPAGMKPRAINIKTGEITYRDETTTSLPTIGGNKQMMVYNIEGGVGIVPVVEQQVSIYNAAGQLVTSEYLTDEVHISLPTGIYLIAGAKDQFKAVVK